MLKVKSVKKLLIGILAVMLIMIMQTGVMASAPIVITGNTTTTNSIQTIPTINSITTTTNTTQNTTTNTANTVNTLGTTTNTNLPNAGLDYSILFVIVACVISGVYAYIKIKDYNNIKY